MALPINPHPIPVWRGTDLYPLEHYSSLPLYLREQLRVRYLRSQTTDHVSGPCYTCRGLVPDVGDEADRFVWTRRYLVGPRNNSISVPASYVRVLGPKVWHDDIETRCLYINDRVQIVNPFGETTARRAEVGTVVNVVHYGDGVESTLQIAWDGLCLPDNTRGEVETDWVFASSVKPLGYEWGPVDVLYPHQLPQPFTPYGTLPSPYISLASEATVTAGFQLAAARRAPIVLSGHKHDAEEDEDEDEDEEPTCDGCDEPLDDCYCCGTCELNPCRCCDTCEHHPCECCRECEQHMDDCECCGNCGSSNCSYCEECGSDGCACNCSESSSYLHSYHSVDRDVDAMLCGVTDPVFGIELEFIANDKDHREYKLSELFGKMHLDRADSDGLIAEEDGSLPDDKGFELVGAPFTLAEYREGETPWTAALGTLDCEDDDRAGMHINMDKRRNFNNDPTHVASYIYALNRMQALTTHVAGRVNTRYALMDVGMSRSESLAASSGGGKYKGVNVADGRIETRVMQSTCDFDTLMMRIEYCDALCSFSSPEYQHFYNNDNPIAPHDLITMFYQHVVDRPGRWPKLDEELMEYDDARMKEMLALRDAQLPPPFDTPQQEATA